MMHDKLKYLSKLLKKSSLNSEADLVYSIYKYAISYSEALKSLESKKTYKAIKNYVYENVKHKYDSYQDMAEDEALAKSVDEHFDFAITNLIGLVPRDLNDNEKGTSLLWLLKLFLSNATGTHLDYLFDSRYYGLKQETIKLEKFFHFHNFMSEKDLFKIDALYKMRNIVDDAEERIREYQEQKIYLDAEAGKIKIYEDSQWEVYEAHNKGAACELGKGTEWCTAAPGLDYFEQYYKKDSPLFIFINKNNPEERYQFSYHSKQFMDINDRYIGKDRFQELHNMISPYLYENYPLIRIELDKNWKDISNEELNKLFKNALQKEDRNYKLVDYLIDYESELSPEVEALVAGKYFDYDRIEDPAGVGVYIDSDFRHHREDGPAVEYPNGTKAWYRHGKRHREDGPAVERANGEKKWYIHNKLHREDGPAVIGKGGTKKWYIDGQLHRDNAPAIIFSSGTQKWYQNGYLHREDGPAVIHDDGQKEWYIGGLLHRVDGPAIIEPSGTNKWYQHGKLHRDGGPAVETYYGTKKWYQNGELHREDGPAITDKNGEELWYMNGKQIKME